MHAPRASFLALFVVGSLVGCDRRAPAAECLKDRDFDLLDGRTLAWNALRGTAATVLITLDPECPFCRNYAPMIDSLSKRFAPAGVRFVGVYAGPYIVADSVRTYVERCGLAFDHVLDRECGTAGSLGARVTPECFVLNAQDELVYRGALDDRAVRAGRHKPTATRHYLADAVQRLLDGREPSRGADAVGCIVECPDR